MSKKRILIVDDDVGLTDIMRINLEGTGDYEIRVENISENAVSAAREFMPDLILLDIVMPGLDGGDVNAQLRADADLRHIPVLVMTALVSAEDAGDDCLIHSGDQVMIPKPFPSAKLVQAIENRIVEASSA